MIIWSHGGDLFLCDAYYWFEILGSLDGYCEKYCLLRFYIE